MEQLLYRFDPDGLQQLGDMPRSTAYALVKAGSLHVVKIGRATYITRAEIERYVAALAAPQIEASA
jgi:hypothetical protein